MDGRAPTATLELLERDTELEQLAARIDGALVGEGSIMALEGEAGIGKSALLAHARQRAADAGMRVLSARAGELEQDFGYGVVRQLFEAPLAAMAAGDRERVLSGAAGLGASALSVPNLIARSATESGPVLHGLYWLTANLSAEQPLLIVVDDAHWADSASIEFLRFLARRVEGHAMLLVYATRLGEGSSERLPAAAEPALVGSVLRPGVLSERATAELIGRLLGSDSSEQFAQACRVATAGNPFLLHELLRALQADAIVPEKESCERVAQIAPGTISRATLARLKRLGPDATRLAFATAVLGKSAALRHAAALARLTLDAAGDAADALTNASILRDARPLEFIHPIVRTTVYAEIPTAQRAATHKRAALLLERDGVGAAELAPHLMASEPANDPDVVRGLRAAAQEVRDRGAPEAACAYLSRALAEPPRPEDRADVLHELGRAELPAGLPGAIDHLRQALEGDLDPPNKVDAAVDFVTALGVIGQGKVGLGVLEDAIATIAAAGDVEVAMRLEGLLAGAAQLDPATSKAVRARLARYEGRLRGASLGEQLLLAGMAFDAAHRSVPAEHAVELAELALGDGRLLLERYPHAASFPLAVFTLFYADRLERADELYTLAVDNARARGSLVAFAIATGCRCQVRLRQGLLREAEAEARSCLEAAGDAWVLGRPMLIACVLDAMVERADAAACHAFLAGNGIGEDLADVTMASRLLYSRGHLRLAADDPAGALRDFEQIRGREQHSGLETAAVPTRASSALAHAQLGEHERAHDLARAELDRARVWGTPSALSFALRAAGIVAGGQEGVELLRESAAAVEHSPRYERIRSLTEYGAALRRAGHRRDAREPLREALELAERCGAQRTAARARRAAGDRRAAAPNRAQRRGFAYSQRAPRRAARRRRPQQSRHRPDAVCDRADRRGPPDAGLYEARRQQPRAARARPGVAREHLATI